jgi:hypothetical protein
VVKAPGPPFAEHRARGRPAQISDESLILARETRRRTVDEAWCLGLGLGLESISEGSEVSPLFRTLLDKKDDPLIRLLSEELPAAFVRSEEIQRLSALHPHRTPLFRSSGASSTLKMGAEDQLIPLFRAYFAQIELANFLRMRQYESNPLTLGNAMAGVPTIGWRQSARRCAKLQNAGKLIKSNDGTHFGTFTFIRALVSHLEQKVDLTSDVEFRLELTRRWLRNQRSVHVRSLDDLRKHRRQLLEALEIAYTSRHSIRERPYFITRKYFELVRQRRKN